MCRCGTVTVALSVLLVVLSNRGTSWLPWHAHSSGWRLERVYCKQHCCCCCCRGEGFVNSVSMWV
jgi:hypothetical protein